MGDYLLRCWGGDADAVAARFPPHGREARVLCYWFETPAERDAFREQLRDYRALARDCVNPGPDIDGEIIETHARTVATLTLVFPDGRRVPIVSEFGYGYPEHSAWFMWHEGNYSCDCNKRLFAARALGEDEPEEPACGDTIQVEDWIVTKKP